MIHFGLTMCAYFLRKYCTYVELLVFPLNLRYDFGTGNVCDLHGNFREKNLFSRKIDIKTRFRPKPISRYIIRH
jgi:hypothetical protein